MIYNIQEFQNRYFTYQDALKFKYTVAWNKTNNNKIVSGYSGFNSFIEYQDLLNRISKIKGRVFFEVIKKNCKAYFDFDKLNITKLALQEFLTEFIFCYNRFFNTTITENEVIVYFRDDNADQNIIKSVHFIITGSTVNKKLIKKAVEYFKLIMNNKIVNHFDETIYTQNRQFSLYNNTKLKYIQEDNSNPKYFIDYKKQSNDPKQYLASYTDGLTELMPTGYNLLSLAIVKKYNKNALNQIKTAFNKLKLSIETEDQEPRQIINVVEPIDIFEYLLFNLPTEFFKSSNDWKQLTTLLKKFGLTQQDFNKWNSKSVLNTNWNTEQNETYYNQLDITKCKSGKPVFKQIIERHLRVEINYTYNSKLAIWLMEKTNVNKETVESILLNLKGVDNIPIEEFIYICSTGFLKKENKIIGNYFIEVELKELATETQLENVIVLENIEDIDPIIETFNTNTDKSILAVKAKWGSGKTHFISRNIINYATANKLRVVFLTENNSLNKQIVSQFSSETVKFISHINKSKQDLNKCELLEETELINIVCSTESIQKIKFKETDILILDEFESILNHYESETFNEQQFNKFVLFKQALQTVNKIVILDADLSNDRIALISKITKINIKPIHILTNNFKDYSFNYFTNKDSLRENCINDLRKDLKIIYASSSKNYLNDLFKELVKKFPKKIIVKLNAEGIEINTETLITKNKVLENLEGFIIDNKVDIFLYTPSIKTGISINSEYFDKCYSYAHNKSVCSREFIQMLFRARLLKQKSINISMNTNIRKPRPFVKTTQIKNYLINPVYLLQTFKIFEDNEKYKDKDNINNIDYSSIIKFDEDFLLVKIINLYENYNSQTRFTQDFLTRMIYNHNIKINYIEFVEADETTEEEAEAEEQTEEEILSEFVKCKLVSSNEYFDNKKLDWREKEKYKFFYETYYIKGITDRNIYNEDIYNNLNNNLFYADYTNKDTINKYKLLKAILDKNINNLQEEFTDEINIQKETNNEFTHYEHNKGKQIIITKLLTEMKLDLNVFPVKITNAEFEATVKNFNFTNFQNELKQYYDNYKIEHTFNFDFTDKDYIKNIKRVITDLLAKIDINIKYVNKNTSGKNDKMILSFEEFKNINKIYNGRLTANDTRLYKDQIKRTKNTFSYNGLKVYPTTNNLYFTTYKTTLNKATKSLMNNTNYDDAVISTNRTNIIIQLRKTIQHIIKPIVITQVKYNQIIKDIYDLLEDEDD